MTKDDIIRMAKEVGMILYSKDQFKINHGYRDVDIETMEKFANLVAAAEHETCKTMFCDRVADSIKFQHNIAKFDNAIKAEREACAKLCDGLADWHSDLVTAAYKTAADAIRARG